MRPSARNIAAIGVLLAWGASVAWLAVRSGTRTESALLRSEASLRLSPGDAWFQVMAGHAPLGIAGVTLDTLGSGYRVRETLTLDLPGISGVDRANRTTEFLMGPDLTLERIESQDGIVGFRRHLLVETDGTGWTTTLSRNGRVVARGTLAGSVPTSLALAPYRLALTGSLADDAERDLTTVSGWPVVAGEGSYRVARDTMVVFADSAMQVGTGSVWAAAHFDSAAARTVLVRSAGGPLIMQVSLRGSLVGLEYPLGIRWVRTDFDLIVRAAGPGTMATNLTTLVPDLPVVRPWTGSGHRADPADTVAAFLVTRRDGSRIGAERLELFAGEGIEYRRAAIDGAPSGDMLVLGPFRQERAPSTPPPQDPLIQESDPSVVAFADSFRTTTGTDFVRLSARLRRIRVDTAATAPIDAAGTLMAGHGRPDGLARLLVAVLHLHGWRARYVIGIAPIADTLFSHAWVEQWSPGDRQWVGIEPSTLEPTPAGMIRLATAGSSHPADMLPMVADVRFARTLTDTLPALEGTPQ
ncbi:MAG TPA: transglutaminase-like domain-containing protein [Gemmatimonadales bacterium]|nr:transglutaminase-like domain-containing protein [Gemmatimonadales bacterium]